MQLSPHFSLAEFTASTTAARHGLSNQVPADLMPNALATAAMLERIRARLSLLADRPVPLLLTSGHRCLQLNRLVGSADTSDHVRAGAADWIAPAFGTPYDVCTALAPLVGELRIGQLIHEYGEWVHTSTRTPDRAVNRVITISRAGTAAGIREV
jgi:zinc D-Ala-D-Ala carboxypeptidase